MRKQLPNNFPDLNHLADSAPGGVDEGSVAVLGRVLHVDVDPGTAEETLSCLHISVFRRPQKILAWTPTTCPIEKLTIGWIIFLVSTIILELADPVGAIMSEKIS